MGFYISLDAGGSKCAAILFDEQFRLWGQGRAGGVNKNDGASDEHVRANVAECVKQLFSRHVPERIEAVYVTFLGAVEALFDELAKYTRVLSQVRMHELAAGLYAGAFLEEGITALAGTGSNFCYIRKNPPLMTGLGGWGPILGDYGSGAWIGQKALQAVIEAHERGEAPSVLGNCLMKAWHMNQLGDMVRIVYHSEAPFRTVASITPIVGEAARAGDETALALIREAGFLMAAQAKRLIERERIQERPLYVVCCGGAWKTHGLMYETFKNCLTADYESILVEKPWFEPVMAGAAYLYRENGGRREEARLFLGERFKDYVIRW